MSHFMYEAKTHTLDFERRDGLTHVISETPLDVRLGHYDPSREEPNGMNVALRLDDAFTVDVPFNNLLPVYYSEAPVVVGSSLVDVADRAGKSTERQESASQMRHIGHIFGRDTRIEGVKRLAAGERLTVQDGHVTIETWDELPRGASKLRDDFTDTWLTALRRAAAVPMASVNIPFSGSALDVLLAKLYLEAGKT